MHVRTVAFACVLLAGLLPAGLAQDAPTPDEGQTREEILQKEGQDITLYGHIFATNVGGENPMPMNTQFPRGEADLSQGTSTGCGAPPPAPADNEDCRADTSNEQRWYSTAGFVQVKNAEEWGGDYGKFHNERGLTKDVFFDTSKPARATYYMSPDYHGWLVALCVAVCWNWDPGYYDDWVVESWLIHAPLGELHSNPSEEPEMGDVRARAPGVVVMAHGKSAPTDMISVDDTVPVAADPAVTEFKFDYEWDPAFVASGGVIPNTDNIIVEWEWYQETNNPTGGTNKYILGGAPAGLVWNMNTGEDYPANVVVPVRNPIDVELVYPQFIHDKLVILSVINTPWGSYDIDPALISIQVKDKTGTPVQIVDGTMTQVVEQSVAHSGHYQPIKPTWVWDYQKQGLKPGEYSVSVSVTNFQHSVTTETAAVFTIDEAGTGTTKEGRSGLQTLQGNLHAGHEGTAADPNAVPTTSAPASLTSTEKSPGLALPLAAATLVALALLRRRRA